MIGPPLMKMWTRFVFWTSALSAPPRDGSSGSVPSPCATSVLTVGSLPSSSSVRMTGLSEPGWGTAMPARPVFARKSAIGPIIANWPSATVPSMSTAVPAKRVPPMTSPIRFIEVSTKPVWRAKRSVIESDLFSTASFAPVTAAPQYCSSTGWIFCSKVRAYSSSRLPTYESSSWRALISAFTEARSRAPAATRRETRSFSLRRLVTRSSSVVSSCESGSFSAAICSRRAFSSAMLLARRSSAPRETSPMSLALSGAGACAEARAADAKRTANAPMVRRVVFIGCSPGAARRPESACLG